MRQSSLGLLRNKRMNALKDKTTWNQVTVNQQIRLCGQLTGLDQLDCTGTATTPYNWILILYFGCPWDHEGGLFLSLDGQELH